MHDDQTLTIGRARRALSEKVWPVIYADTIPLAVAAADLPGEPIPVADGIGLDYTDYDVGTPWGRAWGTTWFRVQGKIPPQWHGRPIEAVIDLGFDPDRTGFSTEGLVYTSDGWPVKALNPRSYYIPITDNAAGGENIEYFIEAAANPVIQPDHAHPFLPTSEGDPNTSSTKPLYTTRRMDLAVLDREVYDLALDLEVLIELAEQLPAGPRKERILAALDKSLDHLDLQNVANTAASARAELAAVLASPAEASAHQLSAIGHAHIDSAWLWPLRETERKVARTTTSMADLIDRTDEFKYGMSSAQQYKWMKDNYPETYARIKKAVASGRFIPVGGMWVESDTVMPSGESIVRQFLQGQRFFEKEFGLRPKGVWLPDSFGYSPALPQLMRRAGFDWFFTQKISWNQTNQFPHHTFWWEGIDGSRILTHFPPMNTYNSNLSGEELAKASRNFRDARWASGSIAPVGYGDGGGGTTRDMIGRAKRLANLEGSATVKWEHPEEFFDRARAEIDVAKDPGIWVGELYLELHRKTLTSQHGTKAGNRRNEHLLVEAEGWAAAAAIRAGLPYPYAEFDELWQKILLAQFHDILPGTSIAWVHHEAVEMHAEVTAAAEAIIDRSIHALAGTGSRDLVANGSAVAQDGIEPFSIASSPTSSEPVSLKRDGDDWILDNGIVRVIISGHGTIKSAIDIATGREALAPGTEGALLQLHPDLPNMWDAWDIDKFYRNSVENLTGTDSINADVSADGTASVTVTRSFGNSKVQQTFSLEPGQRMVEVAQTTDWQEVEKVLKVAFPLAIQADQTFAETQFGYSKRPTNTNTSWESAKFEKSMHRFVYASEPGFGVALVNDSIYGFDETRDVIAPSRADASPQVTTTIRLTLLSAPRFPDPYTDHGVHTERYGMVIGADIDAATKAAIAFGRPLRQITGAGSSAPLVRVSGDGVVLSVVKLADDQTGDLVVRVYESNGARASGTLEALVPIAKAATANLLEDRLADIEVEDDRIDFQLAPFEVRTWRLSRA